MNENYVTFFRKTSFYVKNEKAHIFSYLIHNVANYAIVIYFQ